MFFAEIKRKYFNVIFLIILVVGGYWLYMAIRPSATTTSYDVYKYSYYRPLSKVEFVYFNLTKDYKEGTTIAYSDISDKNYYVENTVILNDSSKKDLLYVIKKLNPNYKMTEKMNDVTIKCSMDEIKPDLKWLEEKLRIRSFYYTGMYASEWYNKREKMIDSPSPYWIYLQCGKNIFTNKEFYRKQNDFKLLSKKGISYGYAYVALDYIGILIGILSILYSFQAYSEDKRSEINGFIYTEKISSIKHILNKYLANVVVLMLVSFGYMFLTAGLFLYWNNKFAYGFHIDIFVFLKLLPVIIFPTIFIVVAINHFIGILIQNEIINIICQFVLFYLSISGVPKSMFSLNTIIRFSDFDDYSFINSYSGYLPSNRILMIVLSVVLLYITKILFEYRKDHEILFSCKSFNLKNTRLLYCYSREGIIKEKKLIWYILRQCVTKEIFIYIVFLCLMLPVVISKNMDASSIATIGENVIIFASIFLFIKISNIEKVNGMEEQVFTSNVSYMLLYLMRVAIVSVLLFFMVEIPLCGMCFFNKVYIDKWCIGVYLSSLFIGMLSLLVAEFFENTFAGYFVYIMYYFLDTVLKSGLLITLSGYTKQMEHTKIQLFIATLVVLIILMVCINLKMEGIRFTNKYGNKN